LKINNVLDLAATVVLCVVSSQSQTFDFLKRSLVDELLSYLERRRPLSGIVQLLADACCCAYAVWVRVSTTQ